MAKVSHGTAEELDAAALWIRTNLVLVYGKTAGEKKFKTISMGIAWPMFLEALDKAPEA
jgi:hypothetical protein